MDPTTDFLPMITSLVADNKELFLIGFPVVASLALGVTYIKRYFKRIKALG